MINAYAPIFDHLGYCVHARKFFEALDRQTPVCLVPLYPNLRGFSINQNLENMVARQKEIDLKNVAICLAYGNEMHRYTGSFRIGYTVFEFTKLPCDWLNLLRQMDEVWVASRWGREILLRNGLVADQSAVIPEGVDPDVFFPATEVVSKQRECYTFLSVGKWESRKGQEVLLRAWAEVFGDRKDVQLLVSWPGYFQKDFSLEKQMELLGLKGLCNVVSVPELPSERHMAALYRCADSFVLASRGEGWGLPILEAMACGLPVITTGYGAVLDYANEKNAYLLPVKELEPVYDPIHFPVAGEYGEWAKLDQQALQELLWFVFSNQEQARELGLRASKEVRMQWTWDHAAQAAMLRLKQRGITLFENQERALHETANFKSASKD